MNGVVRHSLPRVSLSATTCDVHNLKLLFCFVPKLKQIKWPGMMERPSNPRPWEAEADRAL